MADKDEATRLLHRWGEYLRGVKNPGPGRNPTGLRDAGTPSSTENVDPMPREVQFVEDFLLSLLPAQEKLVRVAKYYYLYDLGLMNGAKAANIPERTFSRCIGRLTDALCEAIGE